MIDSADEFRRLRRSTDPVEYRRAAHEQATEDVWLEVIGRYPDMREWVAYNKTVPLSILEVLARDPTPRVRHSVATKRKLSRRLFEQLAADPDAFVRSAIAGNAKTPADILARLATDADAFIAEKARNILGGVPG